MNRRLAVILAVAALGCAQRPDDLTEAQNPGQVDDSQNITLRSPAVALAAHHDTSPPLSIIAPADHVTRAEHEPKRLPSRPAGHFSSLPQIEVQSTIPALAMPTTLLNFDGVGAGFSGPGGTFSVQSAPPDTNGDIGPNHYVQTVNTDFAIFSKTGQVLYGPVAINTLWSGFGGGCQTNNDGDPTVIYDSIADRWVISQFSVSSTPFMQCVAVSQTPDPTGAYYRYSFSYGNSDFNDYPKIGVWPDAYYTTYNIFGGGGNSFTGGRVCAFDRSKMLTGAAATQQCFTTSSSWGGLLPADLDGARQPPAGAPEPVIAFGTNDLGVWKFHVDWTTPSNSTFTGPTQVAVAAFADACGDGTCIPQSGTTQQLDSLADRLMYRLAYRNFGDHESMVVSHSITAGSSVGVRWYELRLDSSRNVSVFQQGTYAPDSGYRWMGSMAQDQQGNIALGFSLSSSSLHPEIHYTGRLAGDAAGQMTQGEGTILNGSGSQNAQSLSRWGDYSMMSVDPSDDCTFWYTTEYIPSNGAFNWSTRIGSFKFPGCGTAPANDFSISATPGTLTLNQGASGTSTIATAVTNGSAGSVALSVSGVPAGATASFNPASVTAGSSSTLTVNAGSAAAGTYSLSVSGVEGTASHSATVSLTVSATPHAAISVSPSSISVVQGSSGTASVSNTGNVSVTLSASGLPSGASASFTSTTLAAGASTTLTVASGSAAAGSSTVTISGASSANTAAATLGLTITVPAANDFSISASPASVSVQEGASGASTISTAVASGSAESIALSVSGVPSGATASFNPASVTAGGSATLSISAGTAAVGTYALTVTGAAKSATHTASVSLTVTTNTPPPNGIVNGGFETGSLSGWTSTGSNAAVSGGHGGSYAARVGSTSPFAGDASISQTFSAPAAGGTLSFFYKVVCTDVSVTYDWGTATLKDNTTGSTATVVAKVCSNTGAWQSASAALTGGHSYTLTLSDHDDGYAGDPTYTLYDDVAIGGGTVSGGITNGGFETGSLSGWSKTGSASVASGTGIPHSGSYTAVVGSTLPSGDSTIAQTFTVPSGATALSFYYANNCPDTVTYDWVSATLKDNTAGTTKTLIAKTCATVYQWTKVSSAVTAGHSYTLTLNSHDDNYPGDPTYTLFDDVVLQ